MNYKMGLLSNYIISKIMVNEGKYYARTMTTLGVAHFPKNRPPG